MIIFGKIGASADYLQRVVKNPWDRGRRGRLHLRGEDLVSWLGPGIELVLPVPSSFSQRRVADGELHADAPSSQLHIDLPASNFAFSQHVDLGHIDVNPFLEGLLQGATNPLALLLGGLLTFVDPIVAVVMEGLLLAGLDVASLVAMIVKIAGAHDTLDVALDTMTAPITIANALDIGQPFLTGILASTLGTTNPPAVGVSIGTSVGSIGFPASGLVGAGLEVALPVGTAFGFLRTEILDKMDPSKPFFGYVSIRLCPQTKTLLGMQQWPLSVMIEVEIGRVQDGPVVAVREWRSQPGHTLPGFRQRIYQPDGFLTSLGAG